MLKPEPKRLANGTTRFSFDDLVGFNLSRRTSWTYYYHSRYWGGDYSKSIDSHQVSNRLDSEYAKKNLASGEWKLVKIRRDSYITVQPLVNDGTELNSFTINENELKDLYRGMVQRDLSDRYFAFEWGQLTYFEMDDKNYRRYKIEMPLDVFKTAINRLIHKTPGNCGGAHIMFRLDDRHRIFHKPNVTLEFTDDAANIYAENIDVPAYSSRDGRTLESLIQERVHSATGYSKNQNDPVTVHISKDSDKSLYFYMSDKEGKRRGYNGGIIFHRDYIGNEQLETGHYSVHT